MSIIGTGDIAQVLDDNPKDRIYFASGVSNSKCEEQIEFLRERHLLMKQPKDAHLIYFSTLSIYYYNTPYTRHKRQMEELIRENFPLHTIIRIGNITWGNNPHTLINNLREKIKKGEEFEVKDEYRYIVTREEFRHWVGMIPNFSTELNITGERMKVADIVYKLKTDKI